MKAGEVIRRYEKTERPSAESVVKYTIRCGRTEREMKLHGFSEYPKEARTLQLLGGAKISDSGLHMALSSADNTYNLERAKSALEVHYPEGVTVAGQTQQPHRAVGAPSAGHSGHRPKPPGPPVGPRKFFAKKKVYWAWFGRGRGRPDRGPRRDARQL